MKKVKFILIILFLFDFSLLKAQILPSYYPLLDSNKGLGNGKVSFHYYTVSSGVDFPTDSLSYDNYIKTYSTLTNSGSNILDVYSGTLNSSSSSSNNSLNFTNTDQIYNITSNRADNFAIIQSGYFIPKQTGTYSFSIEGDDAVDLIIDNKTIADHYGGHAASTIGTHSGDRNLVAGNKYSFRARFQEKEGGEVLRLFWKKPSELNSAIWYQDIEEISSINVIEKDLKYKLDFNNYHSFPLSSSKVYDLVSSKEGTLNNVDYSKKINSSIKIKNNSFIDFGTNPSDFPTTDITVSFWIHPIRFNETWNILFTRWFLGADAGDQDFHYSIKKNGDSFKQNLYTTNNSDLFSETEIIPYEWYNIGFTLINGGDLTFYFNGVKDGTHSNVSRSFGNANLYIGDARDDSVLDGYLNMINIYNRSLTPNEMLNNYNSEKRNFSFNTLSFKNCKEILEFYPEANSGKYRIDYNGTEMTGGEIDCYCDMTTDDGGWTLVLNYLHKGGTNPVLSVKTTTLPLQGSTSLGADESGSSTIWGHAANSLLNAMEFTELRFYGETSGHGRIIHFKTTHESTLNYFRTGLGNMDGIEGSYTLLTGHSALLPGSAVNEYGDQGNYAMTYFPFWNSGRYHWGIRAGDRWEVDDFLRYDEFNNDTFHQIWIR